MKALLPDRDYKYYVTVWGLFRVFPLRKKKNGEYLCDLIYYTSEGKEVHEEWSIPEEYLQDEEGRVSYNPNDIYFGRWLCRDKYVNPLGEDGKPIIGEDGNPVIKHVFVLTRMIAFWNTRVFKYDTEKL